MSRATAENLVDAGCSRMAKLNPARTDLPGGDVGSAVLGIVASAAAIGRVKERAAALDQDELMALVDREAESVAHRSAIGPHSP